MSLFKETNIGRLILESVIGGATEKKASSNVDVSEIRRVSGDLVKVAGLPYKEEVYQSVQELVKVAAEYLKEAADQIDDSNKKQQDLEKAMEMRSIIDDMIHYGILDSDDIESKVAELSNKTLEQIEIVKTAVGMLKSGKTGTALFELDKTAAPQGKRGMFDGVSGL